MLQSRWRTSAGHERDSVRSRWASFLLGESSWYCQFQFYAVSKNPKKKYPKFSCSLCVCNVGFYFIPGALSLEEQCQWIRESLTSFPQPPNRTNHNAIYGPIQDLFIAAKEKRVLVEANEISAFNVDSDIEPSVSTGNTHGWKFVEENTVSSRRTTSKSVPASVLLRKLRWSTLGLQFDWSKVSLTRKLHILLVF